MCERVTSALVGDVCDTRGGRVGLHLHEDVVSGLHFPILAEVLDVLSGPPLVPGCIVIVSYTIYSLKTLTNMILTSNGAVAVEQDTRLHQRVSALAAASSVNADPDGYRLL